MASGRLIVPIAEPILTSAGAPASGTTMQVNISGSSAANLFADAALSVPITNPQVSNAAGRFEAQSTSWWVDSSQSYDIILTLTDGESITLTNQYVLGASTNVSGFAPINSPIFTGNPQAPTTALNDNSASLATTAFVKGQNYAALNSPALTGTPTAPTAAGGTNTTQLATTAFVTAALGVTAPTSTTSGYFKIAGVILQWTTFSLGAAAGSTQTVNWPLTFPTAVIGVPWLTQSSTPGGYLPAVSSVTTSSALITKSSIDAAARSGTIWAFGN